jgi:predicted  nucleic acid-binding Zn-ribbon protein
MGNKAGSSIAIFVPIALALGGAIWWGMDMHKKVSNFSGRVESVSSKQSDSLEKVALIDSINKDMTTVKEYLNKVDHTIGPLSSESHQFAKISKKVKSLEASLRGAKNQLSILTQRIEEIHGTKKK